MQASLVEASTGARTSQEAFDSADRSEAGVYDTAGPRPGPPAVQGRRRRRLQGRGAAARRRTSTGPEAPLGRSSFGADPAAATAKLRDAGARPRTPSSGRTARSCAARASSVPVVTVGSPLARPGLRHVRAVLRVPAGQGAGHPRAGAPGSAAGGARAGDPGRRHRLAGDPAGRDAGPDGGADRRAALGRTARGTDAGARRGRPRPARRLVQPDGHQPAATDPPARGPLPGAAPLRLRRVPRAAHPADDRADGGRRPARGAGRASTRRSSAAPRSCRPSSTGSSRCWPTCWRSAGTTPAPRRSTPSRPTWSGRRASRDRGDGAAGRAPAAASWC